MASEPQPPIEAPRHSRQAVLPGVGAAGQARLAGARAVVVGVGALGTVSAGLLVRAGVGTVVLIDRDVVERSNLQRQALFTDADAEAAVPKSVAAAAHLRAIDPAVEVVAHVADATPGNVVALVGGAAGADVLVDGLDNFSTRYLLNDLAVREGVPYVYGGALAFGGMVWPILPRSADGASHPWERVGLAGQDLVDAFPEAPDAASQPTCETAGVWGPLTHVVGSLQASAALKILLGEWRAVDTRLTQLDLWGNTMRQTAMPAATARRDVYPYLDGPADSGIKLCGSGAVQVPSRGVLDPAVLASRWRAAGGVAVTHVNAHVVQAAVPGGQALTAFADGRVVVKGTTDATVARSVVDRWVGG